VGSRGHLHTAPSALPPTTLFMFHLVTYLRLFCLLSQVQFIIDIVYPTLLCFPLPFRSFTHAHAGVSALFHLPCSLLNSTHYWQFSSHGAEAGNVYCAAARLCSCLSDYLSGPHILRFGGEPIRHGPLAVRILIPAALQQSVSTWMLVPQSFWLGEGPIGCLGDIS